MTSKEFFGFVWRILITGAVAVAVFLVAFVIGAAGPIWIMMAVFGRQNITEAPAHGAGVLFVTIPLGLCVGAVCGTLTGALTFEKLKR